MPVDTLSELCDGEAQRLYDEAVEKITEIVKAYCDEYDDEVPRYGANGVKASITLTISYDLDPIREVGEVSVTSSVKLPKPKPRRERVEVTREGIGSPSRQESMFGAVAGSSITLTSGSKSVTVTGEQADRALRVMSGKRGPSGAMLHGADDE